MEEVGRMKIISRSGHNSWCFVTEKHKYECLHCYKEKVKEKLKLLQSGYIQSDDLLKELGLEEEE